MNLHDAGGDDIQAPVDFVSNAVNGATGTIELRATFANADMALVPGQLVDVTVDAGRYSERHRGAARGGEHRPGRPVCLCREGQRGRAAPGQACCSTMASTTRSQGDLQPGELVVTDGQLRVVPGAKVSITGAEAQPAPAARRDDQRPPPGKHAADNAG